MCKKGTFSTDGCAHNLKASDLSLKGLQIAKLQQRYTQFKSRKPYFKGAIDNKTKKIQDKFQQTFLGDFVIKLVILFVFKRISELILCFFFKQFGFQS